MSDMVQFTISYEEFDNNDIDKDEPDKGWYITGELPDGHGFELGPDSFGPGLQTIEEALVLISEWSRQRGFAVIQPIVHVTAVRREDA